MAGWALYTSHRRRARMSETLKALASVPLLAQRWAPAMVLVSAQLSATPKALVWAWQSVPLALVKTGCTGSSTATGGCS